MNEQMLTPDEIAQRLRFDVQSVRRWIREGKLPAVKLGGRLRVRSEDLDAMLKSRREPDANTAQAAGLSPQ